MSKKIFFLLGILVAGSILYLYVSQQRSGSPLDPNSPPLLDQPPQQQSDSELTGKTWKWVKAELNNDTLITPNTPDVFTIQFNEDMTVGIGSDCNSISGLYTLTPPSQLAITELNSTLIACENSQETEFTQLLREVSEYNFVNGNLVLQLQSDSGSVYFE